MFIFIVSHGAQTISLIAGLFIVTAQFVLWRDVYKRKISPGLLSWFGWFLLMGVSLIAQILVDGWKWSLTGLAMSAFGCFVIFTTALLMKNYLLKNSDWIFLFLGLICLILYLISKDAWITTGFAILADFVVGIPTLIHAYRNPLSQKSKAWMLAFISWSFTLILCIGQPLLYALFPVYLFLYNIAMLILTNRKINNDKLRDTATISPK